MNQTPVITSPDHPAMAELCGQLADLGGELELAGHDGFPSKQLELCGQFGVFQWFMDPMFGGQGWSDADVIRGYLALSSACLTTTFVITQRTGACRRIADSENPFPKAQLLDDLIAGRSFATVGISHLTTSRRHLAKPVLQAQEADGGFVLDGFSPWVTGSPFAQHVVTGATLDDGRQILVVLPVESSGVSIADTAQLVGLTASRTGAVRFDKVFVDEKWLLAGPAENVMQQGIGARTGGLQTSTLALGLADAAIGLLTKESGKRPDLAESAEALQSQCDVRRDQLLRMADGEDVCTQDDLRVAANSLALRATQAALAAAKGTGYVAGHPAGRWCREALFFLVWSCPQSVMSANLCELAGLD